MTKPSHPSELEKSIKPSVDDPDAVRRVLELTASASYRRADDDPEFLEREDLRGIRLDIDYLKPELLLREAGVEHTIVVFGGTRIPENSCYYSIAREFGGIVGQSGGGPDDCRITLMTGGGPGIMEAANRGARDVGAKSIGLNITLPHEQYPNPYISADLCFNVRYFAIRKLHFLMRAKALVVFPGGYGTLDELFETLTLVQSERIPPLPIVLVGRSFWNHAINPDFLVDEGVIDPADRELISYAEDATEIFSAICDWHEGAGQPLFYD